YVAKNLVAADLADEVEIQLAYAIGYPKPVSVRIKTNGTAKLEESKIAKIVLDQFDLSPSGIIKTLQLKRPIYQATAAYGHFGREEATFSWEKTDKVDAIKKAVGIGVFA
ncbi:MAG: methionine adenosyltransferase domain-containing protein, partial [Candidatus Margulisbacteria bacterium]|nr:methionine adenosyltransferase domain-containing protein [Candidatus Margulisiibacteriota bacterium]